MKRRTNFCNRRREKLNELCPGELRLYRQNTGKFCKFAHYSICRAKKLFKKKKTPQKWFSKGWVLSSYLGSGQFYFQRWRPNILIPKIVEIMKTNP